MQLQFPQCLVTTVPFPHRVVIIRIDIHELDQTAPQQQDDVCNAPLPQKKPHRLVYHTHFYGIAIFLRKKSAYTRAVLLPI